MLGMHEVAVTTSVALAFTVLTALSFSKVGNWGKLCTDNALGIVPSVEALHGGSCLLLVLELDIDVSDHVIADVISDNDLIDLTELAELHENLFIEVFEVSDGLN